MLRYNL